MSKQVRLDKLLANMGYGSRREVQALAEAGAIALDGAPCESADQRIALAPDLSQRLTIDGEPLDPLPGFVMMLHKPVDIVCSHKEPGGGKLVFELFPERWRRREPVLSAVGRLDKDTSGLLLLTDDGALLHRIISPKNHIAKRYHVTLKAPMEGNETELFAAGTLILEGEDKPLAPAVLEPLSPSTAFLTITEGRYHQVRRMFGAVRNRVIALHRDRVGGLTLPPKLPPGEWKILTEAEIATIFATEPR